MTMNEQNTITLEEFLFGGEVFVDGDPARRETLEGFDDFDEYEVLSNFKHFKSVVESLIYSFGWHTQGLVTVDRLEADQIFEMPDDSELKQLFESHGNKP